MTRARLHLLLAGLLGLAACPDGHGDRVGPATVRFGGASLGTTFSVQAAGLPEGVDRQQLQADVARLLERIDRALSTWRDDSELARFNARRDDGWFDVSEETWLAAKEAQRVARLSDGALDVTVGPLVDAWGFGPPGRGAELPAAATLAAARARVGWRRLEVSTASPALRKTRPDLVVDLSAVGKGLAVDRIAEHLAGLDVADFLVEVGGELRARGRDGAGRPWRVGIEHPDLSRPEPLAVLALDDAAVATSGDARNAYERGDRRYGHVLDPQLGGPVAHGLASVSVVAPTAMAADALATALYVLGPERGRDLAEREGLAALFVQREGDGFSIHRTSALGPWLAAGATDP